MKKTLAIGTVTIVTAVITGIAWYTGTRVEPVLRQALVEASRQINAAVAGQPLGATLELSGFERGLFASTAYIVATVQAPGTQPLRVEAVADIEHGPFPWSRVKTFSLMPAMINASLRAESNAELAQVLNVPEGGVLLSARGTAAYWGAGEGQFKLSALSWKGAEATAGFSGMEGTYSFTQGGKSRVIDAWVDNINYTAGPPGSETALLVKGVNVHADGTLGASGFYGGKGSVRVEQQLFTSPDPLTFELKNHQLAGVLEEGRRGFRGTLDYGFEDAVFNEHHLNKASLHLIFNDLDIPASRDLLSVYTDMIVPQALAAGQAERLLRPQLSPQQLAKWQDSLERLVAGQPRFWLKPLSLIIDHGLSEFSLMLTLGKPDDPRLAELPAAVQTIHELSAVSRLSESAIWDFAKLKLRLQGQTSGRMFEHKAFMEKLRLKQYLLNLGLATMDWSGFLTTLEYQGKDRPVIFNNQPMRDGSLRAVYLALTGQGSSLRILDMALGSEAANRSPVVWCSMASGAMMPACKR